MIFSPPATGTRLAWYYRQLVRSLATAKPLPGVVLLPVDEHTLMPQKIEDQSHINIGVYLPERYEIPDSCINSSFPWDLLVVPLPWFEYQLKARGISNVVTVLPGWDDLPRYSPLNRRPDKNFCIAVSGTFSMQNGSDLALAALEAFMQLHHDIELLCGWELAGRSLMELSDAANIDAAGINPWQRHLLLERNGIDLARVSFVNETELLSSEADLYLAPARVPALLDPVFRRFVAAGQLTVATQDNSLYPVAPYPAAFPLHGRIPVLSPDRLTVWLEPEADEILQRLEDAYSFWNQNSRKAPEMKSAPLLPDWNEAASFIQNAAGQISDMKPKEPLAPWIWNKRGVALAGLNEFEAAFEQFQNSIALAPFNPETYNCIGNLLDMQGRHQEAVFYFDKAALLNPRFVAAFFNKGNALKAMDRLSEAEGQYRKAIALDPQFAEGWLNLGVACGLQEQLEESELCFRRAVALNACNTDALLLLGNQLMGQKHFDEAIDCFKRIVEIDPDHYLAYNSLGIAWLSVIESANACEALYEALRIKPDLTSALSNIGIACRDLERLDEAVSWFRLALEYEPEDADTHWNLSLALLHRGDYREGWSEYEWRFSKSEPIIIPDHDIPLWDGSPLNGRTILLQAEQGYGDTIQFMRYAQVVAGLGGKVILECQDNNLKPLFSGLPYISSCFSWSDEPVPADFACPLMSLPHHLKTDLTTIPFPEGYLTAPPEKTKLFQNLLDADAPQGLLRVGIAWDGRKTFRNDHRSCTLADLKPLLEMDGICFVCIQKDVGSISTEELRHHGIRSYNPHIHDFSDTAALIKNLDLVISVDTSVAHLAGALAVPVWIMLKVGPDWRWLNTRHDSPWYATATLFRQKQTSHWSPVLFDVSRNLELLRTQKQKMF